MLVCDAISSNHKGRAMITQVHQERERWVVGPLPPRPRKPVRVCATWISTHTQPPPPNGTMNIHAFLRFLPDSPWSSGGIWGCVCVCVWLHQIFGQGTHEAPLSPPKNTTRENGGIEARETLSVNLEEESIKTGSRPLSLSLLARICAT